MSLDEDAIKKVNEAFEKATGTKIPEPRGRIYGPSQSRVPVKTEPQSDPATPGKSPPSPEGCAIPERKPLLEYGDVPPDIVKTLLGNRFLCVEGGLLFIGPSGIGKSSASIQQDILWSIGEPAFGIEPARPLKIVTIQAEDDAGDLSEMVQGARLHLELSPEQDQLSRGNCAYYCHKRLTGLEFLFKVVEPILARDRPDIVRINPLQAFLGGDVKDVALVSQFLRNGLNPLLEKYQCAAVVVHHTPKTNFRTTDNWKATDWMYAGAGAADITNWARGVLVLDPTRARRVFKLIAAKRGLRIGWTDGYDERGTERYFAWADHDSIFWNDATNEQIQTAETKDSEVSKEDLFSLVPPDELIFKKELIIRAKSQLKIGRERTNSYIDALVAAEKLIVHEKPRPNARAEIWLGRAKSAGPLQI
jgi:AAA domain